MKLSRFQVALNHDDPLIVIKGLNEFIEIVLSDHDAIALFGYHGRTARSSPSPNIEQDGHLSHSAHSVEIKGLLRDYLLSSPQIEELFILWQLPGRNENYDLIFSHTYCISVILFLCGRAEMKCCENIVARILSEFNRSISNQLTLSQTNIVHCTLGLLINMCASSPQNSRDTYNRLLNHLTPLHNLLQKGKTVSSEFNGIKFGTDSRHLIIILVLTVLHSCDVIVGNELIANKGLFNRVINGILKDGSSAIVQIFQGIIHTFSSSHVPIAIKVAVVDNSSLQKFLEIKNDECEHLRKKLLMDYATLLARTEISWKHGESRSSLVTNRMTMMIKTLQPHIDLFHRELIAIMLKSKPYLLIRCLNSIPVVWEQPVVSPTYISSLAYLCYLLETVEIDQAFRTQSRALIASTKDLGDVTKCDHAIKSFVTLLSDSLLPSNFVKKDLSRILQHKSPLLRRMGLLVCLRVVQRIGKKSKDFSPSTPSYPIFQGHLTSLISNLLPDAQLLFSLRNRHAQICTTFLFSSFQSEESEVANEDQITFQGPIDTPDFEQSLYFLHLLLLLIEGIFKYIPSLIPSQYPNFDLTRLLDDILPWSSTSSIREAISTFSQNFQTKSQYCVAYSGTLIQTLKVLLVATSASHCRWFGTKSDSVKLLTNLFVSSNWKSSKKTSLQKLFFLSCPVASSQQSNVFFLSDQFSTINTLSRQLIDVILSQSELFQGHGVVDVEMLAESNSWLRVVHQRFLESDNQHVLVLFDILLRIAHHWNIELCVDLANIDIDSGSYSFRSGKIPMSPVLHVALRFASMNFNIFVSQFPKFIQSHLEEVASQHPNIESVTFFKKIAEHFRSDVENLLCLVLLECLPWMPCPKSVLGCILSLQKEMEKNSKFDISPAIPRDISPFFLYPVEKSSGKKNSSAGTRSQTAFEVILSHYPEMNSFQKPSLTPPFLAKLCLHPQNFLDGETIDLSVSAASSILPILSSIFLSNHKDLSIQFLTWLSCRLDFELENLAIQSFDKKVGFVVFGIRTLHELHSISHDMINSKTKRRVEASKVEKISELMSKFTFLVVEIIRQTMSPNQILSALDHPFLLDNFLPETHLGNSYRQILTAVAICHCRRMHTHQRKRNPRSIQSLWCGICEKLRESNSCREDLFCLSWSLQGLVQDSNLRTYLINYSMGTGAQSEGSSLTAVSQLRYLRSVRRLTIVELSPVYDSVLLSGGIESLFQAAQQLCLNFCEVQDVAQCNILANALCGICIGRDVRRSIDSFCEMLSLGNFQKIQKFLEDHFTPTSHPSIDLIRGLNLIFSLSSSCRLSFGENRPISLYTSHLHDLFQEKNIPWEDLSFLLFANWNILSSNPNDDSNFPMKIFWLHVVNKLSQDGLHESELFVINRLEDVFGRFPILLSNIIALVLKLNDQQWVNFLVLKIAPICLLVNSINLSEKYENSCHLIMAVSNMINPLLKDFDESNSATINHQFETLIYLLKCAVRCPDENSILQTLGLKTLSSLNKTIKFCLKYGLESQTILDNLFSLLTFLYSQEKNDDALLAHHQLLEMIVSHSKFRHYLCPNESCSAPFLKVILYLLSCATTGANTSITKDCLQYLIQSLFPLYQGTLSVSDRLIFRGINLAQVALKNFDDQPLESIFSNPLPHFAAEVDHSDRFLWITKALTPPMVYSTLAAFPLWRSASSSILYFEPRSALVNQTLKSRVELTHEESGEGSQSDSESIPEQKTAIPSIDWLHEVSDCLDPAYWFPALHCCLSNCVGLSMRIFANCGGLAFIIAGLGSDCSIIRTYARSCLQIVFEVMQTQTPDKDSAFRERPQLMLLVTFIRNYFEGESIPNSRLPLSSAVFLARSALHLLQSQHNLFSSINKYLLSRPYCDVKDIPLYDLLIVESDIQTDSAHRLAALRLLRDCLGSNEDHLNMCRKNAYSRLMTYFLIFAKDPKLCQAILDVLERAITSCPSAARYLVERCALIPWLEQLSSPINSNHIHFTGVLQDSIFDDEKSNFQESDHKSQGEVSSSGIGKFSLQAAPPKMLFRTVSFLRKTLGILLLLESKGMDSMKFIRKLYVSTSSILRDVIVLGSNKSFRREAVLPLDFLRQLTLLMWDLTIAASSFTKETRLQLGIQWTIEDILEFASILHDICSNNQTLDDNEELELSIYSIISFQNTTLVSTTSRINIDRFLDLTLRHFCLGNSKQIAERQTYCLLSLSHTTKDQEVKDPTPSTSQLNSIYLCATHLVHHDDVPLFSSCSGQVALDPCEGIFPLEECMKMSESRDWVRLNELKHSTSPLPCTLGLDFMVGSTVRTVLNVIRGDHVGDILTYSRWALVMKKFHFDSLSQTNSERDSNKISQRVGQRILCLCDGGFMDDYTQTFNKYLLGYRLAIIAALSILVSSEFSSDEMTIGSQVRKSLCQGLASLLRIRYTNLTELQKRIETIPECAKYFWSGNDMLRVVSLNIIQQCFDLVSALLTLHDRDIAITDPEHLLSVMNSPVSNTNHLQLLFSHKTNQLLSESEKIFPVGLLLSSRSDRSLSPWDESKKIWCEPHYETKSSRSLRSYLYQENINFDDLGSFTPSQAGLKLLNEKMRVAGSEYSLVGEKISRKRITERNNSEDNITGSDQQIDHSEEKQPKKRKLLTSLQFSFNFSRVRRERVRSGKFQLRNRK